LDSHAQKNLPLLKRMRFAFAGLAAGLRAEHSLRFEVTVLTLVIALLIVFRPEPVWWALVALASAGVLAAELFNTALERLADHLHPERHEQIRVVKDCAAAAVLVAVAGSLCVAAALVIHLLIR
jgi:undecaprenol kinase